jgi:3-oxoacyl-[acyl-carrier-protein] synthase II
MTLRRVAITGIGAVTPAGVGAQALWQAMIDRRCCLGPVGLFDASAFDCRLAGELPDFSAKSFVPKDYRKAVKVMARDIEIAVAAADIAFKDSGLKTKGVDGPAQVDLRRLGCNIGAGLICADLDELGLAVSTAVSGGKFDHKLWGQVGMGNLTPLWLLKYLPNMLACHVTIIHGAEGPSNTITCSDPSGQMSIGEAARLIARGGAEAVVAGGAESKLNPMGLLRQGLLGRLCTIANDTPAGAVLPFDRSAHGTIIGEGGALVILEEWEHASRRGAKIYAEVAGFAAACDPEGMNVTRPTCGRLDLAVAAAMRDARIEPSQVGLVVAHGTGVAAEDSLESAAWAKALGPAASKVPAVAFTGVTGSMFAGAGAVATCVAALAIQNRQVPPTAGLGQRAEGCELGLLTSPAAADIEYAVTASFGIGGQSAALVLRRPGA